MSRDPAAVKRAWMLRLGAAGSACLVALIGAGRADPDPLGQRRRRRAARSRRRRLCHGGESAAARSGERRGSREGRRRYWTWRARCRSARRCRRRETQWFPGLSQTGKLGTGADQIYCHALNNILLPRLLWRLEGQMRAKITDAPFLYEATRTYLMLGPRGRWIGHRSRPGCGSTGRRHSRGR